MVRRVRRNSRRPAETEPPIDPFAGLGPGDIGYRLRDGHTGFDPLENGQEQGRWVGLALMAMLDRWYLRIPLLLSFGLLLAAFFAYGDVMALVIVAGVAVGGVLLWRNLP